jgi:hypothetical protein
VAVGRILHAGAVGIRASHILKMVSSSSSPDLWSISGGSCERGMVVKEVHSLRCPPAPGLLDPQPNSDPEEYHPWRFQLFGPLQRRS